jgi:hypothetical protein
MMSIVFHHYKILKEKNFVKSFSSNFNDIDNNSNTNSDHNNIVLKREIEKVEKVKSLKRLSVYSNILFNTNDYNYYTK